jgi:transposase-like protein
MVDREMQAYCPSCKTEQIFTYRGVVVNPERGKILHLYDCPNCRTTRTLTTEPITLDSPDNFREAVESAKKSREGKNRS